MCCMTLPTVPVVKMSSAFGEFVRASFERRGQVAIAVHSFFDRRNGGRASNIEWYHHMWKDNDIVEEKGSVFVVFSRSCSSHVDL